MIPGNGENSNKWLVKADNKKPTGEGRFLDQ
jgi:hypothetical protein